MLIYVLKRLVSALWTLVLVITVSFFLIQLAPGDKAEAILSIQGMSIGDDQNENYYKAYESLREEYGLNQPVFYFSFIPSYENYDYPAHWGSRHKILSDELLNNKIKYESVKNYVNALLNLESECVEQSEINCLREIRFLLQLSDIDDINQRVNRIEQFKNESASLSTNILRQHIASLSDKVGFYFPVFRWNGLDNRFHQRLTSIGKMEFGISVIDGGPVTDKISSALIWTITLTLVTLIFSLLIGIPLSIYSVKAGTIMQRVIGVSMNAIYATPVFWLATLLIVFFTTPEYGGWTDIFPGSMFRPDNYSSWWNALVSNSGMLVLPVFCLTISSLPIIVRITRRSIISESVEPYITALRSRGLSEKTIYRKHIIPNALMPIVTLVSNSLPSAMAGTLVIEVIFNIPGMGRLMYDSLTGYDWDVCFAIIVFMSVVTSVVFSIADVIYYQINPKMKTA